MTDVRAVERLAPHALFARLNPDELTRLVQATVKRLQASKGDWLYLQGEYDRAFYVLDRGSARLLRVEGDGIERVVRELKPGDAVGESALLVGESRDVTLEATGDATFFAVEQAAFDGFCKENPEVRARLTPRSEIADLLAAPRLSWQRADEYLIRHERLAGRAITTRRVVQRDLLGRREVTLRRIPDLEVRPGRNPDVGRIDVLFEGGRKWVWRGVRQPAPFADRVFIAIDRDLARAQAEALARARRALGKNVPPEPPRPAPDPLLSGETDWIVVGWWRLVDWLAARLAPAPPEEHPSPRP